MANENKADSRYLSALWYAFGRIDSGESRLLDSVDATTFATKQRAALEAHERGETVSLSSIQDSWDTYKANL